MAHERKCCMCGKIYNYCSHCDTYKDEPSWRYLFDVQNCYDAYEIWNAYRGKEISKEEAKKRFDKLDMKDILDYDSIAIKEIKDIMTTEKKAPKSEPKKVVVKKDEAPKDDKTVIVNK